MDVKKYIPWNWFNREEEEQGKPMPFARDEKQGISPIQQLHSEMDRIFDQAFRGFGIRPFSKEFEADIFRPTLDLSATEKDYTIAVEIPGVDEKDVHLEMTADTMVIRGEKKQETETKENNFYRMERSYGSFRRVLSLPEDADRENVAAVFKKGVLTITIPRKPSQKTDVRRVDIKSAS
ncbi:Hsp20/alpha crystallin family protein [Seleniivibrio woodruffii]|uniref:HSP20 family protein n=1 Tax=Seleniivibrio woodruffii TaxID=1078050 RepID=A0A4R1K349_9BACT|nr:Hsp20/alpha crystallin family protein [Seleniivibrio woodruffii]TCK58485.1 HSP20 family protein [Seleniivibrio woodruffii]TVZ36858.1 HSP20 family protein [Seleniivibrio woodruffii]